MNIVGLDTHVDLAMVSGLLTLTLWEMTERILEFHPDELDWYRAWRKRADTLRIARNEAVDATWLRVSESGEPVALC